jgi:hypothetical protein
MIGLRRNKRGDMVLTIDTYIDIDSTPDIQSDYFDCIYINTTSERAFHAILFGASPILSYKCSYKPIFVNTAVSGKEQITDYIVDAYVSDMSNEKVYEIIDADGGSESGGNSKAPAEQLLARCKCRSGSIHLQTQPASAGLGDEQQTAGENQGEQDQCDVRP